MKLLVAPRRREERRRGKEHGKGMLVMAVKAALTVRKTTLFMSH
jgi:hypothetical protein